MFIKRDGSLNKRDESLNRFQAQQLLSNTEQALQNIEVLNQKGAGIDVSELKSIKTELEDFIANTPDDV